MSKRLTLTLPPGTEPDRLDSALLRALHSEGQTWVSRNSLKTWFREGAVWLDGRPAKPAHPVSEGRHSIEIRGWKDGEAGKEALTDRSTRVSVAFEDERVLIVDKPEGMPTLPQSATETGTAVNAALALAPSIRDVGRRGLEPGLLHRLDSGTSGCVAFAKTQAAFDELSAAWREERVRKIYRALVTLGGRPGWTPPPPGPREIDVPLAHSGKSSKKMVAVPSGGRPKPRRGEPLRAVTKILAAHERRLPEGGSLPERLWDLEIEIVTGVMHQIRAHVSDAGWPVVGDSLYGGAPSTRLWLHAWRIELPFPDGTIVRAEAPLPSGWPGP